MDRKCKACGADISGRRPNAKFCDGDCRLDYHRERLRAVYRYANQHEAEFGNEARKVLQDKRKAE